MGYQHITFEEYNAKAVGIWHRVDEVPDIAKDRVFNLRLGGDVLTPLEKGKEWLFGDLCQYQPLTGQLLMEGGELFVGCHRRLQAAKSKGQLPSGGYALYIEVNNYLVQVGRRPFERDVEGNSMSNQLPIELRKSYYGSGRVDGLALPIKLRPPRNGRLLPIPVSNGWSLLYHCLDWLKKTKVYLPKIVERFDLDEHHDGNHYGMRVFLVHFGAQDGCFSDSDILILNQDTGDILMIQNGEVETMCFLDDYSGAIDQYCAHILSGKEKRFDFNPFKGKLAL